MGNQSGCVGASPCECEAVGDTAVVISAGAAANYSQQDSPLTELTNAIIIAGKNPASTTLQELEGALEFHFGGADSTRALFDKMEMSPGDAVLDIGCGLGGPAMLCAKEFGCNVIGIDLTPSFIEAANAIKEWPRIAAPAKFIVGDVTAMRSIADNSIDKAYMIHVGMNLPPEVREGLAKELNRVLKLGGRFGVFDPMAVPGMTIDYPLPFATTADDVFLATPDEYKATFNMFNVVIDENSTPGMMGLMGAAVGHKVSQPVVTLESVMGPTWNERSQNFGKALGSGNLKLWTFVFQKPLVPQPSENGKVAEATAATPPQRNCSSISPHICSYS